MNKGKNAIISNKKYLLLKQSNVYKIFESFGVILKALISGDIRYFLKVVERKKTNIIIRLNTTKNTRYPEKKIEYSNEKIAVYTVLFGQIDTILEPIVVDENADYYIVTDQEIPSNSIWKKLPVDISCVKMYGNRQKNRYFKMHAHDLFQEYKYFIYLDANITIHGKISDIIQYINPLSGIGVHNMPNRANIYEEIFARCLMNPKDKNILDQQGNAYKNEGYDGNEGMFECNVLAMMNNDKCKTIMERWWEEYKKYPARDQVSFPYVLWVLKVSQNEIGILGNCMRLNPYFRIKEHSIG